MFKAVFLAVAFKVAAAQYLFSDGFENGLTNWSPATLTCTGAGTAAIDSTFAYTGSNSLKVVGGPNFCDHAFESTTVVTNAAPLIFIRFYIFHTTAFPTLHTTFLAMTDANDGGNDLRLGAQDINLEWNRQSDDATCPSQSPVGIASSATIPSNTWTCLEIKIDETNGFLAGWLNEIPVAVDPTTTTITASAYTAPIAATTTVAAASSTYIAPLAATTITTTVATSVSTTNAVYSAPQALTTTTSKTPADISVATTTTLTKAVTTTVNSPAGNVPKTTATATTTTTEECDEETTEDCEDTETEECEDETTTTTSSAATAAANTPKAFTQTTISTNTVTGNPYIPVAPSIGLFSNSQTISSSIFVTLSAGVFLLL
ncbi:hypothetical protein HK100_007060 [Physocladia obscura]|uniref:Cip1-like core domain-containing protein n=1 Tax=Physocladia obscura TaxID=109957 RepID=A0AAD5SR51_9FUNG|nr:hypothetical protein HK100_007060 [Physocladia obscura]